MLFVEHSTKPFDSRKKKETMGPRVDVTASLPSDMMRGTQQRSTIYRVSPDIHLAKAFILLSVRANTLDSGIYFAECRAKPTRQR